MNTDKLKPAYDKSHAIIIGINEYSNAPPLRYAVNDALGISECLKAKLNFNEKDIHILLDGEATHINIIEKYMNLTNDGTSTNDRVIFYFAGHGFTSKSRRGDIGYLVPCDGKSDKLSTLIRWDELTRNADLIEAKHICFLMDACYGGLAIMRTISPGATRFLKDMHLRISRQVLTAGKANEQVADFGGPLPDHSVFTGHLLEAMNGNAVDPEGIMTANGVMAYVYQMVAHDRESHQTPHFGYLEGDGDLILQAPQLNDLKMDEKKDEDILISIPAVLVNGNKEHSIRAVDEIKELLSEDKYRIKLHDLITLKTKEVISNTAEDSFPVSEPWSNNQFVDRLKKYENAIEELISIQALLNFWGKEIHKDIITVPLRQLCGRLGIIGGTVGWIALRWYPAIVILYAGGISSISAGNYSNLNHLLTMKVRDPESLRKEITSIRGIISSISELTDSFKLVPGHERQYVPRSEYLFKLLQPSLDDLFFLGREYESFFDTFEVLLALEHAHQSSHFWGPVGRFGWKYQRGDLSSPFHRIKEEAAVDGNNWPPIKAGMFNGSLDRFIEVTKRFEENNLIKLGWY